jgi:hypothetical protein
MEFFNFGSALGSASSSPHKQLRWTVNKCGHCGRESNTISHASPDLQGRMPVEQKDCEDLVTCASRIIASQQVARQIVNDQENWSSLPRQEQRFSTGFPLLPDLPSPFDPFSPSQRFSSSSSSGPTRFFRSGMPASPPLRFALPRASYSPSKSLNNLSMEQLMALQVQGHLPDVLAHDDEDYLSTGPAWYVFFFSFFFFLVLLYRCCC